MKIGAKVSLADLRTAAGPDADALWPVRSRLRAKPVAVADVDVRPAEPFNLYGVVDDLGAATALPADHCLSATVYEARAFIRCTGSDVVMTRQAKGVASAGQGFIEEFNVGPSEAWPTDLMRLDLQPSGAGWRTRRDAKIERVAGLSVPFCHYGLDTFGHFVLDGLLQLYLNRQDLAEGRAQLVHWPLERPWMAPLLDRCGATAAVRQEVQGDIVVMQAARLSSALAAHGVYFPAAYSRGFFDWLRERLVTAHGGSRPHRRLYIRRSGGAPRPVAGQERLERYLGEYGFEVLDTTVESVQRQAQIISEADVLISSWGSGLTLAPLLGGDRTVIELTPMTVADPWFLRQAAVHGLHYVPVIHEDRNGGIEPDLDRIGGVLDSLFAPTRPAARAHPL